MRLIFAALLVLFLLPNPALADQKWLVASDLHVDPFDRNPMPSDYDFDTNWPLFYSALAAMHRTEPNPSVVILTGDFLAHHWFRKVRASGRNSTAFSAAKDTMAQIARSFAKTFPHSQFVIVLGNNDDPCGDYRSAPGTPYIAALAKIWEPLVNRRGAAPGFLRDFSHNGSYTARLPGTRLRAIALDDVPWSIVYRSCGRAKEDLPSEQQAWFARTLAATPNGTRNAVFLHIPPGVDANSTLLTHRFLVVPFMQPGQQARFLAQAGANAGKIAFEIGGHLHQNDFRLMAGVPLLIAPSISPIYKNSPAFLDLRVANEGTLRDYGMYAYDYDAQSWARVFDFDKTYGVNAFDAASLERAHRRIEDDPQAYEAWSNAQVAGSPHRQTTRDTWRAYWCAQELSGRGYTVCAGDQNRVALLPIAILLVCGLVVLAVTVAVRRASQRLRA